jgi:hypothetical protein
MTHKEKERAQRAELKMHRAMARLMRIRQPYYRVFKHELPLCGARCRDGHPCQARAAWDETRTYPRNGRCRMHGGLSTGPKTPEGYWRSQALNRWRHEEAQRRRQVQKGETVKASHDFGAVRPTTREAWQALLAEGEVPSVRKLYQRIGGKYPRLVTECRVLRAEGNTTGEAGEKAYTSQRKVYQCDRWPRLRVRHLRFRDGTYTTDDPEEQAIIESADGYGVHIHEAQG